MTARSVTIHYLRRIHLIINLIIKLIIILIINLIINLGIELSLFLSNVKYKVLFVVCSGFGVELSNAWGWA